MLRACGLHPDGATAENGEDRGEDDHYSQDKHIISCVSLCVCFCELEFVGFSISVHLHVLVD